MRTSLSLLILILTSGLHIQCTKEPVVTYTGTPVDKLAFTETEKALIYSGQRDQKMLLMNFFMQPDSVTLRTLSTDVNPLDTACLNYLISRMYKTVRDPGNEGVGIAAPQVGINRNIIWVQRWDKGTYNSRPFEVYLNPRITKYSDTLVSRSDGCLSIPGVSHNSMRAIWINVEYDLPGGGHQTEHIAHQYTAHIFQHEIDHLNGILFIDRFY